MRAKIFQIVTMFTWACILLDSDSYYVPYLFMAILSFICFYSNSKDSVITRWGVNTTFIKSVAIVYSLIVLLANYQIWYEVNCLSGIFCYAYRILLFMILGLGGFYVAFNILGYCSKKLKNFFWEQREYRITSRVFFLICFISTLVPNIIFLFTCEYPGSLSSDSFTYIKEVFEGLFTNKHPFYHAVVVKAIITVGIKLFGDINGAVALYSVVQILFMAFCFSTVGYTLYEMKVPLHIISIAMLWYAFMPFHIAYSFTMWKDVPWGGFVALYTVYLFRMLQRMGKNKLWEFGVFLISGLGVCLFRSNGFFAFVVIFVAFIILFGRKEKVICIGILGVILVAFLMKYPTLKALGIVQADTTEKLSIPLQQISREPLIN